MAKEKSFEEMLKELEQIVSDIQKPDLSLDESMKLYKKGITLSKSCVKELTKAEGTLKKLTGNLEEEDFEIK